MPSEPASVATPLNLPQPTHPLVIRLAFSGHRSIDRDALEAPLARAFALVAEASGTIASRTVKAGDEQTIAGAHAGIWPGSAPQVGLSLLTGYAPGADREASHLWQKRGYGTLHAVFPFADPEAPDSFAWTHGPKDSDQSLRVTLPKPNDQDAPFGAITVLDGEASLAEEPARDAHWEQSRWLVRWADVVIVAWNGKLAAGAGGTADTVTLALEKRLPVLWIDVSVEGMPIRLLSPERLWVDGQLSELVDGLAPLDRRATSAPEASADALAKLLIPVFMPPSAAADSAVKGELGEDELDQETNTRRDYATGDPLLSMRWSGWRSVTAYVSGNLRHFFAVRLAECWARFYRSRSRNSMALSRLMRPEITDLHRAWSIKHLGYSLIDVAFSEADRRATLFGNLHRAIQSMLLLSAVLAVMLGTLPAFIPGIKLAAVFSEFVLLFTAFLLWRLSFVATNHQRWSDTRRLAERLRALKATWPLGFDVGDDRSYPPRTWTEWQARAVRRAAGPPSGFLSAARLREAAAAARDDPMGIVEGQASYNAVTGDRMYVLHHGLQKIEHWSVVILLITLPVFLLFYCWIGAPHEASGIKGSDYKANIGGLVLMLSAVFPAIAAACLAIDAKLGIEENARRSHRLAKQFSRVKGALRKTPGPSPAKAQELLRDAAQLLLADINSWRDAAVRRRIATL